MELLDDCELLFQQILDNVSHRHVVGQPNSIAHRDELPASASKRKHPLTASTMSLIDYLIKRRKSSRVIASSRIPPLDIVRSSIKHITYYHLRSFLCFLFLFPIFRQAQVTEARLVQQKTICVLSGFM